MGMRSPRPGAAQPLIGVLDHDDTARRQLSTALPHSGYGVRFYGGVNELLAAVLRKEPDLLLLARRVRDWDGDDVTKAVRARSKTPIILMGRGVSVDEQVRGLDAGADDYVAKPLEADSLLARIRSTLRRAAAPVADRQRLQTVEINGTVVDAAERTLVVQDGRSTLLTAREFAVLMVLAGAVNRTVARAELFRDAIGVLWDPRDRRVDMHVAHLRRKFAELNHGRYPIRTVRRRGYRLEGDVTFY